MRVGWALDVLTLQNKKRGWVVNWYVPSFTYHIVHILWLSSRSMIKQQAGEELQKGMAGSKPKSRAACRGSQEGPRGKAPDFKVPVIRRPR